MRLTKKELKERRERVFKKLEEGWPIKAIARSEGLKIPRELKWPPIDTNTSNLVWIKIRAVPNQGIYVQCPCCYDEFLIKEEKIEEGVDKIKCTKCGFSLPSCSEPTTEANKDE